MIAELIEWLFDAGPFTTIDDFNEWNGWLTMPYQLANVFIACSNLLISIFVFILWLRRKKDIPSPAVMFLFSLFMLVAGIGNLFSFFVFYIPIYRAFAAWRVITAFVGLLAMLRLPAAVSELLDYPSEKSTLELVATLRAQTEENKVEIAKLNKTIALLSQDNKSTDNGRVDVDGSRK